MQFIHLSDLHIGLHLKNYDLKEEQTKLLEQIVQNVDHLRPDAVVIAGDIYDKAVPSAEAVKMFNDFLTNLTAITPAIPIMVIAGNHDSAERIDCFRNILNRHNVYLVGVPPKTLEDRMEQVTLTDAYGEVHFYLLPFVKPSYVRGAVAEEISTYEDALHALLDKEEIDYTKRNVLVSHQFYQPANQEVERMESEIVTVGNIDAIPASLIQDFDYAALGHIHKPMKAGAQHLRYCGTPMEYSVDEAGQKKGMLLVTLKEKGQPAEVQEISLEPLRHIEKRKGRLDELLMSPSDNYISITLTDEEDLNVLDMQERLRAAFPHLLEIRREHALTINYEEAEGVCMEDVNPYDMFCQFFQEISEEEKEIVRDVINCVN